MIYGLSLINFTSYIFWSAEKLSIYYLIYLFMIIIIIYPRRVTLSGVPQTWNTSTQPITRHQQPQNKQKQKHTPFKKIK